MARPLSWLPRLYEIRRSVSGSKRTHYDTVALEQLFQIQPRAAGKLMELLPQVGALGRSRLVERGALAKFLDDVNGADDPTAFYTQQRKTKKTVSRKIPRLLVRRDDDPPTIATLPASIKLQRGRMEVSFETPLQLMEAMYWLAQVVDGEEFEGAYCVAQPAAAEDPEILRDREEFLRTEREFDAWIARKRGLSLATKGATTELAL